MRRPHRYARGAAELIAVLLLAALAGAWLAAHYAAEDAARRRALDREAGRVFTAWVLAAHRASKAPEVAARLAGGQGFTLIPAVLDDLGAAPPGLPARVGRDTPFTLGIVDDGRGVAMAFGVLEPERAAAVPGLRDGAMAAGLATLAGVDEATPMAAHLPAIEQALGRPLGRDALYLTADHGLRYRDDALHRRPQPGRPWLNRMETGFDVGGHDVRDAAAVSGDAKAGGGSADADANAGRLEAGSLAAGEIGTTNLVVSGDLVVGRAMTGAFSAGSIAVTGRLEAAQARTARTLSASTLAVADTTTIGAASAQTVEGEILIVTGELQTGRAAATGIYGPDARISGTMKVERCAGC